MSARLVEGQIPNLVNGVSQQAPALRLVTQGELQENFYSTIVEGLKDRPPTETIAKLLDSFPSGTFTHVINRDAKERYIVLITPTPELKVFDFEGNEKVVNAESLTYLEGVDTPENSLRALTVADYTFITNNRKVVAMKDEPVAPTRPHEALVNVLLGNYGKRYRILVNGSVAASWRAPNGSQSNHADQIDTVNIAETLYSALVANNWNVAPWSVKQEGNAIYIANSEEDFEIAVEDGFNGNAMKVAKDRVQRFTDLPAFGEDGFVVEVVGDDTNVFDNYWVKFETASSGPGIWRETLKPGTRLQIDATTMPHHLIREADGTFTFKPAEWDERKCGDEEISPDPSFVGGRIEDVYFYRNRLGFLTDENAVLSRSGSFFDFFRTTATALLDDDPIDTAASHVKVSLLKHALPFQDDLVLFSEQTQFTLAGNELLTPKTVSARPRTEYVCDPDVSPIGIGTSVFFCSRRGEWASIWEYVLERDGPNVVAKADEVTSHVPAYIRSGVTKLIGTPNDNMLLVLSDGAPNTLYVYKFYWQGNERLQSAWSKWTLDADARILDAEFIESDVFLVVRRPGGVFLEKMNIQPSAEDEGMGFMVHLDRRIHTDKLPEPVYDADEDETVYTLPYTPEEGITAVTAPGGITPPAENLPVLSFNTEANTVTLSGDRRSDKLWFGYPYTRRYRFSRFFIRQAQQDGGSTVVQRGRLQVNYLTISYDSTAYFRVEVTPEGRGTYVYPFTGRILGDSNNILGEVPSHASKQSVPIMSRSDRVTIDLVNDSWMPCAFVGAEWIGKHSPNAKER